jgi:hypothetical protein
MQDLIIPYLKCAIDGYYLAQHGRVGLLIKSPHNLRDCIRILTAGPRSVCGRK